MLICFWVRQPAWYGVFLGDVPSLLNMTLSFLLETPTKTALVIIRQHLFDVDAVIEKSCRESPLSARGGIALCALWAESGYQKCFHGEVVVDRTRVRHAL